MTAEQKELNAAGRKAAKELDQFTIVSLFKDAKGFWYRNKSGGKSRMDLASYEGFWPGFTDKLNQIDVPERNF